MNADEIRALVLRRLAEIAPEADLANLDPTVDIRDALDLDSMDFLRLATAVHESLGVDIPESDYRKISTLQGCIDYLTCSTGT